jgi:hypothetical protein
MKRRERPISSQNRPKVPAIGAPRARGPLRIGAPAWGTKNRAILGTSRALTLWGPAPGGALVAPSPLVAAMLAPRSTGSIDRALQEAGAIPGPLPLVADASVPPEVAPFVTGVVVTPRRLAAVALGPLLAPGSHFLELIVFVQDWLHHPPAT